MPCPATPAPPIGVNEAGTARGVRRGVATVVEVVDVEAGDVEGDDDAAGALVAGSFVVADEAFAEPGGPPHDEAVKASTQSRADHDARLGRVFRSTV